MNETIKAAGEEDGGRQAERAVKVVVSPQDIEVRLRQTGIGKLALELRPAVPEEKALSSTRIKRAGQRLATPASDGRLTISVPIQIQRRSGRKLMTLPNGEAGASRPWDREPTPVQLALAQGHRWLAMLEIARKVWTAAM